MRPTLLRALALTVPFAAFLGCGGRGGRRGGPEVDPCSGNPFTPIPAAMGTGGVDPGATPQQQTALTIVNGFRLAAGAAPVNLNAAIDSASTAHATYYVANPGAYATGLSPHQEAPGYPGFTGVNFWDRLGFAGYA